MQEMARLIFGGRIYTMSEKLPVADAMIVRNGRIAWIGSAVDLSAVPADSFEMVDLEGGIVLPGFVDSHVHLFHWARSLAELNLSGAKSYEEVLRRIRKYVAANPRSRWLGGGGWQIEQWRKPQTLHRAALDRICSDRPLALFSKDDHSVWVNSKALESAGITADTSDPPGGVIERDHNGEPSGILRENAAWLLYEIRPALSAAEARKTLKHGIAEMLQRGCVGVHNFDKDQGWETLQRLEIAGDLPVRVTQYFNAELLDELIEVGLRTGFGSDHLKVGGMKFFADGALGSQTALMLRAYKGSAATGVAVTTADELMKLIKRATRHGLSCATHAIGDRANRNVLDAIAAAKHVSQRFRHRIEHCQIVAPADVKRFAQLGVVASMQPSHATADIDLMRLYLGKRAKHSYRFRDFARQRVRLAFGSDAPIEPLNPLLGIHAATVGTRIDQEDVFNKAQLLNVAQAVHGFTLGAATAVGEQRERGSLEIGKLADLVVLDRDIMRGNKDEIHRAEVLATMVDGAFHFRCEGFGN